MADPIGWHEIHEAHGFRSTVRVTIADGREFRGPVARISNHDFTVRHEGLARVIQWSNVVAVEVADGA